ncbi:MAG: SMC-Scp complex subunit ScpB [Candidatus Sumerlaeota bacterium]|nr:SMC-Scp complex subunit ScpB [Candidatus Sumerlaeota bacterium]
MTSHAVTNDMPDGAEDHSSELFTLVEQLEYVPAPKRKKKDDSFSEDLVPVPPIESVSHARAILEAMLFSTNDPLSVARLCKLMNNLHPRTVRGLVLELQLEYERRGGGLQIADVAGGYQMATRTPMADWVMQLHRQRRRNALSPATLETLAIIAYKQPVTRAEIEVVRGVESGATVRTLQDIGLVDVSGRRDVPGRPQLHVTTDSFLKIFGLRSLADLPSIAELKHLFTEKQPMPARISAADSPHEDQADTSVTTAEEPLPQ